MKRILYTFLMGLICAFTAIGQPYDLTLNTAEIGTQLHQATNSITFVAGYSYYPNGGTMLAEIVNAYLTGSVSYNQTVVDPASRSLNTFPYLVGSTKGAFDVNAGGGASYAIPIDLLPGVNGLAPSLSLVYSSNSGPGVAGYGWQIGGISAIGRTGKTIYNDGTATGVDLTSNDRFILDGQRLVLTSGSYGADQGTYRTEIDEFSRIQSQSTSGSGPGKFMVQTKSGLKNLYGSNDDGCQRINGNSEVLNWYLTETSDLYGNLISYKYMRNNYMVYPAEISYGPNKITFTYKLRTDVTISYLKGQKIEQHLLLDKITVAYNNNVVKTYELKYNYLSNSYFGYSVLNEVIEFGTSGSRLNSTAFTYQAPENAAFGGLSTLIIPQSDISANSILFPGDFNGDGYKDLLTLDKSTQTITKIYLNNKKGSFNLSDTKIAAKPIGDIVITDLNGDNVDDFIIIGRPIDSNGILIYYWMLCNGAKFGIPHEFANKTSEYKEVFDDINNRSSDFDGDGFEDFLVITKNSSAWEMYSFTPSTVNTTFLLNNRSGTVPSWGDKVYLADFNGDGKTDIWSFDITGLKIYALSGVSLIQIYSSNYPDKDHCFEMGDFNGDGKTDLFVYGYSSTDWVYWKTEISTGIGFEEHSFSAKKTNLKNDKVYAVDFNGDGRTDILSISKNGTTTSFHNCFFSNLNGTELINGSSFPSVLGQDNTYALGDYDGNGKTGVIVTAGTSGYRLGYTTGASSNTKTNYFLLKSAGDGLGNITSINYTKLTDTLSYSKGTDAVSFPVFKFQGAMPVVRSVSRDNGIGGTNSLSYYYEGAKIHRQGKGLLGFAKTTVTDATSGMLTETLSGYNSIYYYPQVNTVTKKTTGGSTVETVSNIWDQIELNAATKRIFPYVSSSTQTNGLTSQSVITTASGYDNYGNPGTVTKVYKTGTNNEGSQSVAYQYLSENVDNWLLGRPTKTTTTYTKGTEIVTQVVNREFSTTTNRDTAEVKYPGTDKQIRYSHVYYPNGNLKKEMLTSGGVSRSTSYTYKSDNVRVSTVTDPLGHVTTRNYYPTDGLLSSQTDYLNNTNSFTYDGLGEILTQTQWDGFVITNSYNWEISTITNSVHNVISSGNDGSVSKKWYDKLNREIRLDVKGFDGNNIYKVTKHNTKGQLEQISEPSTVTNPTQWSKYYYLTNGRLDRIEEPTGNVISYAYDQGKNKVTVTSAGKSSWKETNSQGLVTKAHDNGGDITYTYYPDAKVDSITAPGGAITTMEYNDAARNQTKLIDPSAGTINYTYDGFGQLKTQTNAQGQLTTYNYHSDGRTNTVVFPASPVNEGTNTYGYNATKQLTGISNPTAGVSRAYGYDIKGRVTNTSETISGVTFPTSFTYDNLGRLETRTHPNGIVEKSNYNVNTGYFEYISVGSTIWYRVTGMNARQQVTAATYGTGATLIANYGFDTYGYPTSTASGSVQNYSYSFDPITGNLSNRRNVNKSIQENFLYDSLDRLDSIYGNANSLGGVDYDFAKGNITRRSGIGKLSYNHPTIPYAITDLNAFSALYPASPDSIKQRAYYTSFNKIRTISDYPSYRADFIYNSDQQRAKMTVTQNGANVVTRTYANSCDMRELIGGITKDYAYIGGDAYSAPIVAINTSGTIVYYYLLRDYLGNITHVYNASTSTAQEYSFDAWGRRRNPTDWSYSLTGQPELFADRGFTSHEYLKYFNMYNMNGRMYDPLLGRFLNPDPYVQMPDNTQNFNRYSYCLNNPLKYNDPDGELIFTILAAVFFPPALPFAIQADIAWMTDYGMQVGMNYASGLKGKDAWLKKIDWFDVGTSAVIGGATGGFGAQYKALKNGEKLSRLGSWVLKNRVWITLGEMALTSGVDITGEGVQKVSFDDFTKRFSINLATFGVTEFASDYVKYSVKNKGKDGLPTQKHHFATNKNKIFTPQMESIAKSYGLDLDGEWNTDLMEHLGRHPNAYHNFVLRGMQDAAAGAGDNKAIFLYLFNNYVKQPVLDNPLLLRKAGW